MQSPEKETCRNKATKDGDDDDQATSSLKTMMGKKCTLDSSGHLKKYGFGGAACDKCAKKNSEIGGFLMQCALCKDAYYCSTDCFNGGTFIFHTYLRTYEPLGLLLPSWGFVVCCIQYDYPPSQHVIFPRALFYIIRTQTWRIIKSFVE